MTHSRNAHKTTRLDYGFPGNDLNPKTETPDQARPFPFYIKIYAIACLLDGVITFPVVVLFVWALYQAVRQNPSLVVIGDPTLAMIMTVLVFAIRVANAGMLIFFAISLLRNRRRHAARWTYILLLVTFLDIICTIMLTGVDRGLIQPSIQLIILLVLSVTVDPSLRQERVLQRRLRDLEDEQAASEGMLGRDLKGKGYIELNFFNLFWVFVICSVLGLIIETVYHMVVVDPGVYQDRAGMLFGPFSPIYGVGAVLMTCALNRFYRSNPFVIFVVSAIIGGLFEFFVSWFMQVGFGATAWNYTGMTIFGVPDPIAIIAQGRTATPFMMMWGALGFVWVKLCLPHMLRLINRIPWKIRYSFTTLCAILMLVNAVMTLQSLDCWFERLSGISGSTPIEQFYAEHFDNQYMQHRFQSMEIHPEETARTNPDAVNK